MTTQPPRRPTRATSAGRAYLDLQNAARSQQRDTSELLQIYALEGFLDRLGSSPFRERLVLKGGVLLAAFGARRPTRDIDVAARGLGNDTTQILGVVRAIATADGDDGLVFDHEAASALAIREDDEYSGVRVTMPCALDRSRLRFHVDVSVGDPVWPAPGSVELPRLLGGSLRLLGYPLAMVYAEKIVTAVQRGQANTRWRDFADIHLLSRRHEQHGAELVTSVRRVGEHRKAQFYPLAQILDSFASLVQSKWSNWRRRQRLDHQLPEDFADILTHVILFAGPALDGSAAGRTWSPASNTWNPRDDRALRR